MGLNEKEELVQDQIIEVFSDLSGLRGGIEGDTVVYEKNSMSLFVKLCEVFAVKACFQHGLMTIEDYSRHFLWLLDKKAEQLRLFYPGLQAFVQEKTRVWYDLDEVLFSEYLPVSEEPVQRLREVMSYELKLGKLKNQIRNRYGYFRDSADFSHARTLRKIGEIIFWPHYRAE